MPPKPRRKASREIAEERLQSFDRKRAMTTKQILKLIRSPKGCPDCAKLPPRQTRRGTKAWAVRFPDGVYYVYPKAKRGSLSSHNGKVVRVTIHEDRRRGGRT